MIRVAAVLLTLLPLLPLKAADINSRAEELWRLAYGVKTAEHECSFHTLGCNTSRTDTINIYGCRLDSGYYTNLHQLFIAANTNFSVTVQSSAFASDVFLLNEGGVLAQAPGSAIGSATTVNYTITTSGTYTVGVVADPAGRTGTYSIVTSCQSVTSGSCSPSGTESCLLNGRFRVSIAFRNQFANPPQNGNFLAAKLVPGAQNPDVATFGISSAQAIEVVVRIQDTRPFGLNRFDVYYGGLTDLEYTVTVTDTLRGVTRTYRNPPGTVGGGVDRSSFIAN
jgi:hypothetical protein